MVVKDSKGMLHKDMSYKVLYEYLESKLNTTDTNTLERVVDAFNIVVYPSDTSIDHIDDVAVLCVIKGGLICSKNGVVFRFCTEGDFIFNERCVEAEHRAHDQEIKTNEFTITAELNFGMYFVIKNIVPEIDKLVMNILHEENKFLRDRVHSFQELSAKMRMETFYAQYPDNWKRFKKYYIASYLGIQKETLSRFNKS